VSATLIEGRMISSSLVRQFLREGRVEEAAQSLGRPHRIRGRVAHGAGRGRGLGFPTINLTEIDVLMPAEGVYAARAWVDGRGPAWPAACNIGPNPTFGEAARKVEAHLIGFTGELYARSVEIDILRRLRATRPFSNVEELLSQIRVDVEETSRICAISVP
jgi:riboflavin kinase/FMN adenylyltransferase